ERKAPSVPQRTSVTPIPAFSSEARRARTSSAFRFASTREGAGAADRVGTTGSSSIKPISSSMSGRSSRSGAKEVEGGVGGGLAADGWEVPAVATPTGGTINRIPHLGHFPFLPAAESGAESFSPQRHLSLIGIDSPRNS